MSGQQEFKAYTDGACSGNPGPGGWGVLLHIIENGDVVNIDELKGGAAQTTNNRMELMAAIKALESLEQGSRITLVTDSKYVKDGMLSWLDNWKKNNWRTSRGKPVKNVDLWQRLDAARDRHDMTWEWVKGHAGHPENEKTDELARAGMKAFQGSQPCTQHDF